MNLSLKLLVVFVTFATLVSCSLNTDELCRFLKENEILINETSDSTLQLRFEHSFVDPDRGIVPGLRYNVTLRTTILESGVAFVLSSYPAGKFEPLNPGWTTCEPSAETLVGSLAQDSTFSFTAPKIRNESILFSLAAFLPGTKQWSVTAHKFAIRSECYYILPNEEATLTSAELASQDVKSTLIQSPQNSGLQVDFEDVIIPTDGSMFFYNVSESSTPILLSRMNFDQMSFLLSEDQFLLVDAKRCSNCRFQLLIKPIAVKYECNSTLRLAQGALELVSHSPPSSCELFLKAPPYHRVLVKTSTTAADNCSPQKLLLGPLAGVPTKTIWTSCNITSPAQKEFYISESNLFRVYWDGSVKDVVLHYEFLPFCSDRTFAGSPFGRFCSTGYPNVIFGCKTVYSIYVPLGFSIQLQLNVLGIATGALCQNNTLDVVTRNYSIGSEVQLMEFCLDASDDPKDSITLHSFQNTMVIRTLSTTDYLHKGFCATYKAVPQDPSRIAGCDYGWVSGDKFCYKVFEERLRWKEADEACQKEKGRLASITDKEIAHLIDNIILTSPIYKRSNAFWIGANDLRYENRYEWLDGQAFDFSYWFPGWEKFDWYSVQPSDDGLSEQNCVELRNVFRYPSKGQGITDTFYWNDRDCLVTNPFVCQRLKPGESVEPLPVPECNQTISLSWESPRQILTSPKFPGQYPENIECHYYIIAPIGQRIVLEFSDFILEESLSCEYDILTLIDEDRQWYRCGNWESKIKLLRYVSNKNFMSMIFITDYSHSFKGFRIEVFIYVEKPEQSILCDNEVFQLRGKYCYLVVNYLEASWATARQICSESKSKLAVVENAEQVSILDDLVRSTHGYLAGTIYWVGASASAGDTTWKWIDGTTVNSKHLRISRIDDLRNPSCLAIQWTLLRASNALRWMPKNCNHPGRFICQKPSIIIPEELNKTVSQLKGNLTSVNYPFNYLNNMDYIAEIIGPSTSRVVLIFYHFDIEWQDNCLYDYVLLQNDITEEGLRICGEFRGQREFVSSGNKAYMSFHSDFSISSGGYRASWEIVDLSVCLNRRVLILEPTHITSLRYPHAYLTGIECRNTVIASEITKRLLITIRDIDLRECSEDYIQVNLDPSDETKTLKICSRDIIPGTQLMAFGNEAQFLFHTAKQNSMKSLTYRGYNITCEIWSDTTFENTLYLKSNGSGRIYNMNFHYSQPIGLNYTQRVVAQVGYRIHIFLLNITQPSSQLPTSCDGSGIHIRDSYAHEKTLLIWTPCRSVRWDETDGLWSTLHVLHIVSWNFDGSLPLYSLEYDVIKDEHFVNTTLALGTPDLESCRPNPCQHGGRCLKNETSFKCHCFGQYTGLFCHVTWCDIDICGEKGICNLTSNGWICDCFSGYGGSRCELILTPCTPNPCGEHGNCSIRNGTFFCQCGLDYAGPTCERIVMRIPYKPLSQRMIQEPFWLGLMAVFIVLIVIFAVYCIKRKFADKIDKFLVDEIERSKYQPSPPATRYSLSSTQPSLTPGNQSPQTNPKSLFNRIRKNSLLSAACSPSPTPDRDTSRTFSFDDILRRVHSSKRNRTSNNSPSCSGTNQAELSREKKEEEKSRILASLVTPVKEPASRRMSLDEFFRMSERKLQMNAKRSNSTDSEGGKKETSFINMSSPKTLRQSFSEIQSIQEQSFEYMSSSESLSCEANTSEIQVDVSPTPPAHYFKTNSPEEEVNEEKSPEHSSIPSRSTNTSPTPAERTNSVPISITIDKCDSDSKPDSESDDKNCDSEPKSTVCEQFTTVSPIISRNSSYLQVPKTIPAIQVFSAESDEPQSASESLNFTQGRSENFSPCRKDFSQPRKYSVDLPMPKILITTNMNTCDSDEASPPRTPNPNKSMMYLSPLAVISSSTDRTISESNLSTSGYSSISSPGLSRCNSSSPISDDVEHQHHHPNCTHKTELQSPKKPHGVQMTYLSVGSNDKAFFFPQTIACHCHTPNQTASVMFEPKATPPISTVWTPGKHRLLCKRNSYQTTSTDDSIDDEGIGLDNGEFKVRKGDARSTWNVDMFVGGEKSNPQLVASPLLTEPSKPDLLACSVNSKSGNGNSFKGSPRTGNRKGEKPKKYGDKHRRSPVLSPAGTPIKDAHENPEIRIPRNSSRTSMSGPVVSSSESDDSECFLGARQKSRRSKKHDAVTGTHKQPLVSMPSQDSSGPRTDKSSDATGRSSPLSESNGDSAPMDSRSPASSSSESLSSTRDCAMSEKTICNRHKIALEHTRSFPPLSQCSRHSSTDEGLPNIKIDFMTKIKSPVPQADSEEEVIRSSEDHPYLRRQEAIVEDDPSDDSSSETTVLLGRQTESPRNLQQSSSADVSEWEAFNKE